MTAENSKGMKDVGTSNVSHVSRKPLQCIQVTTPYAGHVVEVTFRSHYNAYDLFSNTTRFFPSFFIGGEILLYSNSKETSSCISDMTMTTFNLKLSVSVGSIFVFEKIRVYKGPLSIYGWYGTRKIVYGSNPFLNCLDTGPKDFLRACDME